MEFYEIFIFSIIIIIIIIYYDSDKSELIKVLSKYDQKYYYVQNLKDADKAAYKLSVIKYKLISFLDFLHKKYKNDKRIKRCIANFNYNEIYESSDNSKYTSYSVNKGEKLVLCLRSRDKLNNIVDNNTIMFVALHELAHMITKSIGHTDEFWNNFRFILREAIIFKIYKYSDYSKNPRSYCGIKITNSPL